MGVLLLGIPESRLSSAICCAALTKAIDTSVLPGYGPAPIVESLVSEKTTRPAATPVSAAVAIWPKMSSSAGTTAVHLFCCFMLPDPSRTKSRYAGCRLASAVAVAQPASSRLGPVGPPPPDENKPCGDPGPGDGASAPLSSPSGPSEGEASSLPPMKLGGRLPQPVAADEAARQAHPTSPIGSSDFMRSPSDGCQALWPSENARVGQSSTTVGHASWSSEKCRRERSCAARGHSRGSLPPLTERATFPLPWLSRLHAVYAVWGAAAAVGATLVAGTVAARGRHRGGRSANRSHDDAGDVADDGLLLLRSHRVPRRAG